MTTALEGGKCSAVQTGRTFTPGKKPIPIVQEAGWAPGPVLAGGKSRPPPEIDPRTIQPVVSHYTDWATRSS